MPPAPDLHPDDLLARVELRAQLRELRETFDLSQRQVTRLAGFGYVEAVRDLEQKTSWEAWRVQQWARGLGRRLRLSVEGVELAPDDTQSLVLRATTAFGGFDEDQLHLRTLAADLRRTRCHLGFTQAGFARRCRVSDGAIREFEGNPLQSWLRTYQRYARGLGGWLGLDLMSVVAPERVEEMA